MFSRKDVSVFAWMVLIFILTVPVLNVIFVVFMMLRGKTNRSIKNFFFAYLFFYVLALLGMFTGTFENMQSLFNAVAF